MKTSSRILTGSIKNQSRSQRGHTKEGSEMATGEKVRTTQAWLDEILPFTSKRREYIEVLASCRKTLEELIAIDTKCLEELENEQKEQPNSQTGQRILMLQGGIEDMKAASNYLRRSLRAQTGNYGFEIIELSNKIAHRVSDGS